MALEDFYILTEYNRNNHRFIFTLNKRLEMFVFLSKTVLVKIKERKYRSLRALEIQGDQRQS